jgi:hypothetical protein
MFLAVISCNTANTDKIGNKNSVVEIKEKQQTSVDYSGTYKSSDGGACNISVIVSKQNGNYVYKIEDQGVEYSGNLMVENQDGEIYFTFDGKIEDNAPKTISGKLVENSIMIQNYGNAMNEYNFFKKCDSKFIELKK